MYICQSQSPNSSHHPTTHFPPLVSIRLFSTSVSLFLPCKPLHLYHFSRFHIYALIYGICFSLSDLLHSVGQSLGPSMSLEMTQFCSFLWLILHCIYVPHLLYPFICWWAYSSLILEQTTVSSVATLEVTEQQTVIFLRKFQELFGWHTVKPKWLALNTSPSPVDPWLDLLGSIDLVKAQCIQDFLGELSLRMDQGGWRQLISGLGEWIIASRLFLVGVNGDILDLDNEE